MTTTKQYLSFIVFSSLLTLSACDTKEDELPPPQTMDYTEAGEAFSEGALEIRNKIDKDIESQSENNQ